MAGRQRFLELKGVVAAVDIARNLSATAFAGSEIQLHLEVAVGERTLLLSGHAGTGSGRCLRAALSPSRPCRSPSLKPSTPTWRCRGERTPSTAQSCLISTWTPDTLTDIIGLLPGENDRHSERSWFAWLRPTRTRYCPACAPARSGSGCSTRSTSTANAPGSPLTTDWLSTMSMSSCAGVVAGPRVVIRAVLKADVRGRDPGAARDVPDVQDQRRRDAAR